MAILTVSQLREHVETDLGDDAVQRLADAAEEMILRAVGSAAAVTELYDEHDYTYGRERSLYASLPVSSITSVKERDTPDGTQTTLAADDYSLRGNRELLRLRDGTNPRLLWAPYVEVIYTPATDAGLRKLAQINLVKLASMYSGATSETMGDFSFSHGAYADQVRDILATLHNGRSGGLMV